MKTIWVLYCFGEKCGMFDNESEAKQVCEKENNKLSEESFLNGFSFSIKKQEVNDNWCRGNIFNVTVSLTSDSVKYDSYGYIEGKFFRDPEICVIEPCILHCFGNTGIDSDWQPSIDVWSPISQEDALEKAKLVRDLVRTKAFDFVGSKLTIEMIRNTVTDLGPNQGA